MAVPPHAASKPVASKRAKAGPTDEQHEWIKTHFNRDMRALTGAKAGAAIGAAAGVAVCGPAHAASQAHAAPAAVPSPENKPPVPPAAGTPHQGVPAPSAPQQDASHPGAPHQKDTDPDHSLSTLWPDRTIKAAMRYATKARVLDGQHRNPYNTINLFPTNRDFPSALATTQTARGQAALTAKEDGFQPLSLEQAKGESKRLRGKLRSQKAALGRMEGESNAARGTVVARDAETAQAATAAGTAQVEQRFGEAHAAYTSGNQALGKKQWEVSRTTKELAHAREVVSSGRGSAETFEGFFSNGKDGASVGTGLTAGTALVTDAKAWAKGDMTGKQLRTDVAARGVVSGVSSLVGTGLGTEFGALVGTRLAVTGAHVAQDTEKGIAVGSKFGGRTGALVGGFVAGGVSVATAVLTAHIAEHKDAGGKSLIDRVVDKFGGPSPEKGKELNPLYEGWAKATDQLSPGVKDAASFVGAQVGGSGGGRAALSIRSSKAAIRHAGDDLKGAETALQEAAGTRDAATQALSEARAARNAMTEPKQVAGAAKQVRRALAAERNAITTHAAREAEHEVAQKAVAAAKKELETTGSGFMGKGRLAAKAVLKWDAAEADKPLGFLQKGARIIKTVLKLKPIQAEVKEGAAKVAGAATQKAGGWGGAALLGAGKLVSHAGFMGAAVSGVVQAATDYGKVKSGKMGKWQAAGDVGLQAVNGGLSGLAGAAAGAFAGAEAGAAMGVVAGPLGLVAGTLVGATVGMAVSLGAGVVLNDVEHGIYNIGKGVWGRFHHSH